MSNIKGLSPLVCTHRIYLDDNNKPSRDIKQILQNTIKPRVCSDTAYFSETEKLLLKVR